MPGPLIIGGGPAGAAAAAMIAAAGHRVTVLERTAGPTDKVCGDFLSGGALAALRTVGFDPLAAGAAPIRSIRLVHRTVVAKAPLPFPAASLSRRHLDEALLQCAARHGATILRGQVVRSLRHDADGFHARFTAPARADVASATPAGSTLAGEVSATTVFLATGKHDLRGHARPRPADGWLGLKMYYRLLPDQQNTIAGITELHLLRDGYAGLQPVEQDRAVLCVLLPASRYRRTGGTWSALLDDLGGDSPLLARRLSGAQPCLARPLAIAGIPYGHLQHPAAAATPGLFRLGDQACVVPSLAGDGVAIALHSGLAAAAVWLRHGGAPEYHARLARQAAVPLRFAGLIHAGARHPGLQMLAVTACRAWPGALRLAAAFSRVAPQA